MTVFSDEARGRDFKEVRRGYDPAEVRRFQSRVVETLGAREEEIAGLRRELERVRRRVTELEAAEEAVKQTYLAAGRQKQEIVAEAEATADDIRSRARAEADAIVAGAREHAAEVAARAQTEQDRVQARLAQLRTAVADLESRLRALVSTSLEEVAVVTDLIDLETKHLGEIAAFRDVARPDDLPSDAPEEAVTPEPESMAAPRPEADPEEEPVRDRETVYHRRAGIKDRIRKAQGDD